MRRGTPPRDARELGTRSWAQRLPALPPAMADFPTRGFRLDDPVAREVLEGHARAFLDGYNLARTCGGRPHEGLARVPEPERGFAYEGAAMLAGIVDAITVGRARAVRTLLAGPGCGYRHLVHVGLGWVLGRWLPTARLGNVDPLLRWLAIDGAGFSRTFFSPQTTPYRLGRSAPGPRTAVLAQGSGRALWFVHASHVPAVAEHIASCPAALRPHLWSGVGLAATYAGPPPQAGALLAASGDAVAHLQQGSIFAATARLTSGTVPEHTARTLRELTGLDPVTAARWSDEASRDLVVARQSVAGYLRWRTRLRARVEGNGHGPGATGALPPARVRWTALT